MLYRLPFLTQAHKHDPKTLNTPQDVGVGGKVGRRKKERKKENVLDQVLALLDLEAVRDPTEVNCSNTAADFATDAARAELVGHGRVRVQTELHAAALAATL